MRTKKTARRTRIRHIIRNKIQGGPERPRLSVFKSNRVIYAQLIDDTQGRTLAASRSLVENGLTQKTAYAVGEELASKAQALNPKSVKTVVFDRGGWKYHGCVRALAEGARNGGLVF